MRLFTKIAGMAMTCFASFSLVSAALPPGYTGTPFQGDTLLGKPQQIPGVVKGVFVDVGGGNLTAQGYTDWDYDCLGYGTNGLHDSSYNAVHPTAHLGWMGQGQILKYTIHVNTAGTYYVDFKLANVGAPPNLITLTYYDGAKVQKDSVKDLPAVVEVIPPPGGVTEIWHNWTVNFKVDSVALDTGLQVLQIGFMKGAWNYDWARFYLKGASATRPMALSRTAVQGLNAVSLRGGRIVVSCNVAAGPARISLVDCAGKTMLSSISEAGAAGSRTAHLEVSNVRPGIYFVNVKTGDRSETKSITITR
jgi:hypothetical protein